MNSDRVSTHAVVCPGLSASAISPLVGCKTEGISSRMLDDPLLGRSVGCPS